MRLNCCFRKNISFLAYFDTMIENWTGLVLFSFVLLVYDVMIIALMLMVSMSQWINILFANLIALNNLLGSEPTTWRTRGCSASLCERNLLGFSAWQIASAVTISVNKSADGASNLWKKRQWRSVQSIIGATHNFLFIPSLNVAVKTIINRWNKL